MTDQQRIIQRLWYTAPSRIDSNGRPVQGGERFRRCATTDSLNEDIYKGGAQVRALERYTLYTPPDDTARDDVSVYDEVPDLEATNKSDVPICLALLDILHPEVLDDEKLREQLRGRVLVNKLYLGRVGDGREGNVFIDLLACLPEGFSAREALALWRAPDFWRQHYASTHAGSMFRLPPVELPSALLNEIARRQARRPQSSGVLAGPGAARPGEYAPYGLLRNPFAQISLTPGTEKQLTEVLTFLIHAYLLQQHEEWTENNTIARDLSTVKKELEDMRRVKQKTGFINANIGISGQIKKKEEEQRQIEAIQLQKKLHFKRIYLAVEDDQAAYGLTLLARLLQDMPALLQPLTFSTYEYKVLDSDCLIVCTSASRAGEKDHQKVEKLLPDECKKLGFVYNAYDTANNPKLAYQLPFNPGQFQMGTYRVESVARNLARQLLRPTEKFDRYVQEVAVQISANGSGSPAQQLVEHWQKKLVAEDLLNKPYISRGEAIRMFEDPQWWECLEEPVLARQVWQWAIADCKGLDLDEASQSWFTRRDREAAGVWLSQTLLPAIEFFVRRRAMEPTVGPIAAFIAKNLGELLVEYADNLVQPALYNSDEIPAHQSPVASTHTRFDVIIAQKRERDPEAFEALLRTLQRCEPAMQGAPTWTYLLSYLFTSSLTSKNQRTFLHLEAGSFVLRPLYDTALQMEIDEHDTRPLANMARCHWNIHMRLLQYAIQVLPESLPEEQSMLQSRPLDLIMPLLQIPLQRYLSVFGKGEAQGWYLSWRREALDYQIDQFRHNGQIYRFTGHYGDYYRVTSRDTQLCRDFIGKPEHWPTHLLLVLEAMACLDDWEDALPLLEPDVP
ncbi:MAG TPA: hypothetical protein VN729_02795, partial [Ktedonobacteraceae bacterium]|nr:hypothetical protein [Ktedonobacteraceae bacterium]